MKWNLSSGVFCLLLWSSVSSQAQAPTFEKDIAPIIHKNCTPCHRTNEAAPFPLVTYEDVAKRASFIREVVSTGYMPPWKADNNYVHYANDRSLRQEEVKKILTWIDNKAPRGKKETAKTVTMPPEGTLYGRKPDLVLKANKEYALPGDNVERFIIYKIPFELPDSANVEAVEFYCNNKKIIHHANYAVHPVSDEIDINDGPEMVNLTESDRMEAAKYQVFKSSITYYGGWIPGSSYETYPQGIGWVMPKRGVVLLTVHYSAAAADEVSTVGVNLFFTKTPVKRKVKVISFGSGGIGEGDIDPPLIIPANAVETYTLKVKNPNEDFSLMYVWPHMHLLGKSFLAYGIAPSGDTIRLTSVPDWDFRWQEIYKFRKLVKFPRGTELTIKGVYDNTANNPFNPSFPPRTVYSGGDMRSKDEMLTLMLVYLPYQDGDENISLTTQ